MRLQQILEDVPAIRLSGDGGVEIREIAYASGAVSPGSLFAALRGIKADGFDFVPEALDNGAAAVLSEREKPAGLDTAWVQAADTREALALCSANFFRHPSRELKVIGITGTKGKTTITYLLESILRAAGHATGLLGTIQYRGPGLEVTAQRTTPEAPDLQRMMRTLADNRATHCVMEVSSHALDLKRPVGVDFDVAVFTNLSGEHLDYHKTMEDYFRAKLRLFTLGRRSMAVVNGDDEWGRKLMSHIAMGGITYGLAPGAMVRAEDYTFKDDGTRAAVKFPAGRFELESHLLGKPNLYNILAAAAAALTLNIPAPAVKEGIRALRGVPGRFQKIANTLGLRIFVDYAHTDDALRNLLETARELKGAGRVIVVFGAGGDRDRSKRPRMGEAAGALADWSIITSDNPRSEDPLEIIRDIEAGIHKNGRDRYEVEPDRRAAIGKALRLGLEGDTILVAGKGHEDYQIIKDRVTHFDDSEIIREILGEMDGS
jgi:UDP-N-acetylmuramoyl-L-alanyl-D-glutamate--2,6-diaminopimelate ligase